MTTNNGRRGKRGIQGEPGRAGKKGATGVHGATGSKGATGATGLTGRRGAVGAAGRSQTRGTPHLALAGINTQLENVYKALDVQIKRMAQVQAELDSVREKLNHLARRPPDHLRT